MSLRITRSVLAVSAAPGKNHELATDIPGRLVTAQLTERVTSSLHLKNAVQRVDRIRPG